MEKSLLLVVDLQECFINDHTKEIPTKIKQYLVKNKNNFDFVAFTKFVNKPGSNFVKLLGWRECLAPKGCEIAKELLGFVNKKNTFEKQAYSAFKSKKLLSFIKKNKIRKIFICGLNTDACILATAFEGFDLGFETRVLKPLCGTMWGPRDYNDLMLKVLGHKIDNKILD